MKARHQITLLLKQWLQLTRDESHSVQIGRWSELSKIQQAKNLLQEPLTEALDRWKHESPEESDQNLVGHEIACLRELEAQQSKLLAVRKREVREKILLLEQALDDLCRFRPAQASKAA